MSAQGSVAGQQRPARKRPLLKRFGKRKSNPMGEMTLVEHLQELRKRIVISLVVLAIGAVIGFIWYEQAPLGLRPLGEILRGPYCELPAERRASFSADGECRLLATSPFEMLTLRLKVGTLAGTVLASPIWLYQIWAFIVPGLHKNEKKYTFIFVTTAVILFVGGAVLAYYILSVGLEFLMSMGEEFQTAALTGERYYYYLLAMLLIFGVSFEIPLLVVMLNIIGILEYRVIRNKRRIIFVVILIFAAVVTPGQEVFSMIVLGVALEVLIESAFQFCRINDKRRNRNRPNWLDVDDESASALDDDTTGIGLPTPVEAAQPVSSSHLAPRTHGAPPTAPSAAPNSAPSTPPNAGYFDDVL
ncbi:twin-arginine translocase subunit TatC [Corynebacterium striatum]